MNMIPEHSIVVAFSYCQQTRVAMPNPLEYLFSSSYLGFFSFSSLLESPHLVPRTYMTSDLHIESVLTQR